MSEDGFYWCGHCGRLVEPTQRELDVAENAPSSQAVLKCPHCRRWAVIWRVKSIRRPRPKPVPVTVDHAAVLFLEMKQAVKAV